MKTGKLLVYCAVFLLLSILFLGTISAITASLGNGRMVLRLKPGETIEKHLYIKNVNNVSVEINLQESGDLADYIKIKEKNFTLAPGKDKYANFTIKAAKEGTTESKIFVTFKSIEDKKGIGLSSTIIVIAAGEEVDDEDADTDEPELISQNTTSIKIPGLVKDDGKISYPALFGLLTLILFLILLILLIIYLKKEKNKKLKINQKRKTKE